MTTIVGLAAGTRNDLDSAALQDVYNGTVTTHNATTVVVDVGGGQTFTMTGTGFGNFNGQNVPTTGTVTGMIPPGSGNWSNFSVAVSSLWTIFQNGDVDGFNNTFFSGNDNFISHATAGNTDRFYGYGGDDIFSMVGASFGANAILSGGDGNDTFQFAANFDPATNQIDGGAGTDTLVLNGNYSAGVTFGAGTMVNVEKISLTPGNSYNLTTDNATVAAGQTLTVNGTSLGASDVLTFNGAAETDGSFRINGGAGNDVLTGGAGADVFVLQQGGNDIAHGGAGNDGFNVYAALNAADQIDGGTGADSVNLKGNYSGGLVLGATTITNVETVSFSPGFSYNVTENNANVASGQTLTVNASSLGASDTLTFNGAAETDGKFIFTGGAGNDVLTGGAGTDVFNLQNGGNDVVHGGGGNDIFNMTAAFTAADQIDGGTGADIVNLKGNYSGGLVLGATTITNVETLSLSPGFSYNLTENNGNVASGQRLTVNASSLGASDVLTFNGAAETDGRFTFTGGAGNDVLTGGAGTDVFNLQNGGNDIVHGGGGNDTFNMAAAFTAADQIDGGAGTDVVWLDGDYSQGVTFLATTMVNVETINLAGGHSYNLTTNAATVAAGQTLKIDGSALGASDMLTFNGAAETTYGSFTIIDGAGNDVLTGGAWRDTFNMENGGNDIVHGGAQNDSINMYGTLTAADQIDGGGGDNSVSLDGDYSGGLVLGASTITNVDYLRFAPGFSYNLTANDATVAHNKFMSVDGSALGVSDSLAFDGSAETDTSSSYVFRSGLGADHFTGGAGWDHFIYSSASESTSAHYDTITGFTCGVDRVDSDRGVHAIDPALTTGALNTASFDSDLTAAVNGHLLSHDAELFTPDSGTLSGETFLIIDQNGVAGYQSGADLVIHMSDMTGTLTTRDIY